LPIEAGSKPDVHSELCPTQGVEPVEEATDDGEAGVAVVEDKGGKSEAVNRDACMNSCGGAGEKGGAAGFETAGDTGNTLFCQAVAKGVLGEGCSSEYSLLKGKCFSSKITWREIYTLPVAGSKHLYPLYFSL